MGFWVFKSEGTGFRALCSFFILTIFSVESAFSARRRGKAVEKASSLCYNGFGIQARGNRNLLERKRCKKTLCPNAKGFEEPSLSAKVCAQSDLFLTGFRGKREKIFSLLKHFGLLQRFKGERERKNGYEELYR